MAGCVNVVTFCDIMVSLYFGLPRCGKTTLLAKLAYDAVNDKKHKYKNVYSNVDLNIDGVTFIDNDWIGKYDISDGLVLIDEGTLFADSRNFKSFGNARTAYFMLHGHFHVDIVLFTQQYDGVDRKIRVITENVYYVWKPVIFGKWITRYYRVPYSILIPSKKQNKKSSGASLGEITEGYCKPSLFQRIFAHTYFRKKYYQYFNSWEKPSLPPIPDEGVKNYFEKVEVSSK